MRIDAHHHLWDLQAVDYPWLNAPGVRRFFGDPSPIQRTYSVAEFRRDAEAMGMEGSVHIQVGAADSAAEAAWVQQVAEANPGWPAAQVVFADLRAADLDAVLGRFTALPTVRGVRQILGRAPAEDARTGSHQLLYDARFAAGLQRLARHGLRFDLQLIPEVMPRAAAVFADVPDLPVALCHAGSPRGRSWPELGDWAAGIDRLAALPQVTCKLSGFGMFEGDWNAASIRPIVAHCLDRFGPERCMFGSNFPIDLLYASYDRVFTEIDRLLLELKASDREAVLGTTAARFYGIPGAAG